MARTPEALKGAVDAATREGTDVGPALVQLYGRLADPRPRRDSGAVLRTEVVRLLDGLEQHDIDVYRRALRTFERLPPADTEVAAPLRAAALAALAHADSDLAGYEAELHLSDVDSMTGEPALTAIRVLGALGLPQPIYGLVVRGTSDELAGEALRHLTDLPVMLAMELVEHIASSDAASSPVVLAGLVDLVLGHRDGRRLRPQLLDLLGRSRGEDVVRYAAAAAVARRDREFFDSLRLDGLINADRAKAQSVNDAGALW